MVGEGFRVAGAYVEVRLQDNTEADEKKIRARLEKSGPINFETALKDPANTKVIKERIRASAPAVIRTDADTRLAQAKIRELAAKKNAAVIAIDADISKAQARIDSLEGKRGKTKIDVDAEVSKAQAKIEALRARKNRILLQADVDETSLRRTSDKVDSETAKMAKRANAQFSALQFGAMFAGLPVAAAGAAALTVGALSAVPAAAIAYSAVVARENAKVQASFQGLADNVKTTFASAARPMADEFATAADQVNASVDRLKPEIGSLFADAAPDVAILTSSITSLTERAFPGLDIAAARSQAPLLGLRSTASAVGDGFTDMFRELSQGADAAGHDIEIIGGAVSGLLGFVGQLGANLANSATRPLSIFTSALDQTESTILTLTSSGSAVYGFFNGFGASVNGMLTVLRGAASLISLLPDEVTQFGGSLLATARVAQIFGVNAFAGFDGLADKVKEAEGAGGKLKTVFTGLAEGALNPTMLAVTGLSIGLQILGQHQADAAAQAAAHADRVRDLADALRSSNGAIDDNVKKTAAMALQDFDAGDGKRNLLEDVRKLAGNQGMQQLTQAYLGNNSAADDLRKTLLANIVATVQQAGANDDVMAGLDTQIGLYQQGKGSLDDLADSLEYASQGTFSLDGAQKSNIQSNVDLLNIMGKESGTFQQAAQGNRDLAAATAGSTSAFQTLTREQQLTQQSAVQLQSAFGELGDSTEDAQTQVTALQTVLDQLTGRVPTHEEALQSMNDTLRQMGDEFGKNMDHAKGFGSALLNADGTINTASENGSALQDSLVQLQTGFAQTAQSMNGLVASGVPLAQAQQQVNGELVTARQRFIDTATAMGLSSQQAQNLADKYGLIPAEAETAVLQPGMLEAITNAGVLRDKVVSIPNAWSVQVSALTQQAETNLINLGYRVTHLPNGQVIVTAPNAGQVENVLNGLVRTRTATIVVNTVNGTTTRKGIGSGAPGSMNAIGNVLKPMASGGVVGFAAGGQALTPMAPVASVVPRDTWRVVGDNMRVPESYIPWDGSTRSRQILADTNEAFGNTTSTAPVIDYGAIASAVADAMLAVFAGGVKASFDTATMEKGLLTLARRRAGR